MFNLPHPWHFYNIHSFDITGSQNGSITSEDFNSAHGSSHLHHEKRKQSESFNEVSCSKEVILSPFPHPREVITSPNFPHNYHHPKHDLNCTITVKLIDSHVNLPNNYKGRELLTIELIFSYFKSRDTSSE